MRPGLDPILNEARFFVMIANCEGNLKIARDKSVWSTSVSNELIINQAFKEMDNVILFFVLHDRVYLEGIARVAAPSCFHVAKAGWESLVKSKNEELRGIFKIDWISTKTVGFSRIGDALACLDRGEDGIPKVLATAGDGSELKPEVGKMIASLIPVDAETDIRAIQRKVRSYSGPDGVDTTDQDIAKPPSYDDYMKYYFPELATPVDRLCLAPKSVMLPPASVMLPPHPIILPSPSTMVPPSMQPAMQVSQASMFTGIQQSAAYSAPRAISELSIQPNVPAQRLPLPPVPPPPPLPVFSVPPNPEAAVFSTTSVPNNYIVSSGYTNIASASAPSVFPTNPSTEYGSVSQSNIVSQTFPAKASSSILNNEALIASTHPTSRNAPTLVTNQTTSQFTRVPRGPQDCPAPSFFIHTTPTSHDAIPIPQTFSTPLSLTSKTVLPSSTGLSVPPPVFGAPNSFNHYDSAEPFTQRVQNPSAPSPAITSSVCSAPTAFPVSCELPSLSSLASLLPSAPELRSILASVNAASSGVSASSVVEVGSVPPFRESTSTNSPQIASEPYYSNTPLKPPAIPVFQEHPALSTPAKVEVFPGNPAASLP